MNCAKIIVLLGIFGGCWQYSRATCVVESDFGFILNCAFKKSGLFRIRNLGGVKAHIGLGFSLGDELGFKESISNVEQSRRRSAQASRFQTALIQAQQDKSQGMNNVRSTVNATTIPPFKPIPPAQERIVISQDKPVPAVMGIALPSFNKMPSSISRLSSGATIAVDTSNPKVLTVMVPKPKPQNEKLSSTNFSLRTLPTPNNEVNPPAPARTNNFIQALLSATNLTEEALESALLQRQKNKGSTTVRPPAFSHKISGSVGKVMNAPKEYYPVGYDKNFDDNFSSKVELPETSFYCGDQKHFPGLYADEDLGCMVFHVCALTDDGLIMKSFLCPESTLFDQTILKCNYWFYVDCKSSKKLYDSNIPISKSYQLMKALTFFSSYKKDATSTTPESLEKD